MRARVGTGAAAGILAASSLLCGCRTTVIRKNVERRIERRLANYLGPAEKYRVRIRDTGDAELVRGRARRVEVEGRGIEAREQVRIESVRLTLDDLRYVRESPLFVSVARSDLEVELTDAALNEYARRFQARYDPEIHFDPGRVRVRIVYPFLGVATTIRAAGRLVIEDSKRLMFDADAADVSFLNTPGFGEKFVEDRVNPLLDLSRIDFPARLESVQVLEGRLRARGTATLPAPEG